MRISDILRIKGEQVVTVAPETTVRALLTVLAEHGIGAVIVSRDGTSIEGIVSERDVVRALANRGDAVLSEPVTAIHTPDVHTVAPDSTIADVEQLMTQHRFRHVPVVVDGRLRGILSIGDIVKKRLDELEGERSALTGYITGERS